MDNTTFSMDNTVVKHIVEIQGFKKANDLKTNDFAMYVKEYFKSIGKEELGKDDDYNAFRNEYIRYVRTKGLFVNDFIAKCVASDVYDASLEDYQG